MSLAMYAAPFDNDSSNYQNNDNNYNDNDSIINKKRQTHNKTQKKYPKENFDQEKVNSVLEKIHSNLEDDDDKDVFIDCDTAILIDDVNNEPVNEFATIPVIVVSKFVPTFADV